MTKQEREALSALKRDALLQQTRRHFFGQCGIGLGSIALGSLLNERAVSGAPGLRPVNPLQPRPGHFPPKARNVIFLFMAGGPSQLELFDYKPRLIALNDKPIPESFIKDKRFAFMDTFAKEVPKLLGTRRKFARHGKSGVWVSELFPHIGGIVDDLTFIRTCKTDVFNHAPAKVFMNTGTPQFGRPSMGSWITYGIGSESQDLPGFVVLQSGPRGPRGGAPLWGSGFLPTMYQGVPFRSTGEPILNLSNPKGISPARQRRTLDAVRALNLKRLETTGDAEIATRIASYEMAYRMQTSAPELMDVSKEDKATLERYGVEPDTPSYARNCLLARRLVERGVRFVQLYHTNWDHHGGKTENLEDSLTNVCGQVDQASAALVMDLKARGMLDETLVIWGGEFGRTPMGENRDTIGRNHHIDSFTMWMAGGGVKAGYCLGETDELGFGPVDTSVHVHDLHATILHLLGIEHTRLTFRFQGRDFRLTDVFGQVVKDIIA